MSSLWLLLLAAIVGGASAWLPQATTSLSATWALSSTSRAKLVEIRAGWTALTDLDDDDDDDDDEYDDDDEEEDEDEEDDDDEEDEEDDDGHGAVQEVDTLEEFEAILGEAGGSLVVVDFSATWCGPCRQIAPAYAEMSEEDEFDNVVFLKVDVDENAETAQEYEVQSMPTFVFIKEEEEVARFSGADAERVRSTIRENM